ncbi:nucleoside transporter [candidate division KSB1 bacterium]|nr:nucleoside transporter [candidate division KSB1 bacterium]
METYNLVSLLGIFLLLGFAWLCSTHKKAMNWRVILWGTGLQILFAAFIFLVPAGSKLFLIINDVVIKVLSSAQTGTEFVFGRLALPPGTVNANGESSLGFFLAFQGLATIIFFASLMGILYFLRIMPLLIQGFARLFTRLMRISGAESLCAASNIFVGAESALTIRPYLDRMTRSELTTILTAGMSTVASSVMALYVFFLQQDFPTIAGHLVSASILSAPAALVMSKILLPETETPETLGVDIKAEYTKEQNVLEAAINGANSGVKLVVGVTALLLAFLGLVALLDLIVGGLGGGINRLFSIEFDWTIKNLLGYLFYPFTLIIGIPAVDAMEISRIIGERLVVTEVAAYQDLSAVIKQGILQAPRSAVICTYALCGFAHVASLAIFVGGISALAPGRTADLSKLGPRALLAATLACLMTAAVAGTFFNQSSILLGQ